jgi:hypothetical protein
MRRPAQHVFALFIFVLLATCARAEDWTTTKSACRSGFNPLQPAPGTTPAPAQRLHNFEECAVDLLTLDPVGPTLGNIGTGSGFGGGVRVSYSPNANQILTLKGLYSTDSSYVTSGQYRFVFRPIRPIEIKSKSGHPGQIDDTHANLDFNLVRFDLRVQDFYGLGPNSTLAGHAVYRQIQTSLGVNGYMPIPEVSGRAGIIGVLGELKYLSPITKGVTGDSFPSVNVAYGDAGAPGSTTQANFVEAGAGLSIRTPTTRPLIWEQHEAQVMYRHYFDQGSRQYSFDRLEAWGDVVFTLLKQPASSGRWAHVDYNRSAWKDALCMQTATGGCEIGALTFTGRVTTSYTADVSQVPFYLQPTLGGADFYGVDTLRGLVDYRLRAPNRLLMQVDFDKPIAQIGVKGHPLGQYGLYTFFDAGNVSLTPGTLTSNGMRTDVGVGFSIAVQNKIVMRVYIAFGAGEGSHPNAKMANAF